MTGLACCTPRAAGTVIFRYRQSSLSLASVWPNRETCGQGLLYWVASSVPAQRVWGTGGANLRSPVGGNANGIPLNSRTPLPGTPRSTPASVPTCSGSDDAAAKDAPVARTANTSNALILPINVGIKISTVGFGTLLVPRNACQLAACLHRPSQAIAPT